MKIVLVNTFLDANIFHVGDSFNYQQLKTLWETKFLMGLRYYIYIVLLYTIKTCAFSAEVHFISRCWALKNMSFVQFLRAKCQSHFSFTYCTFENFHFILNDFILNFISRTDMHEIINASPKNL